jgi:hypothetical protein
MVTERLVSYKILGSVLSPVVFLAAVDLDSSTILPPLPLTSVLGIAEIIFDDQYPVL